MTPIQPTQLQLVLGKSDGERKRNQQDADDKPDNAVDRSDIGRHDEPHSLEKR